MKKKSLFRRLLPWIITLIVVGGLVWLGVLLYTQADAVNEHPPVISYYEGGSDPLTMENDSLLFELDPTTTQFVLTEKKTGRVWRSNPENAAQDSLATSSTNKSTLQSTLVVAYSSSDGTIPFNNYQYSIQNGSYRVEQAEDGAVRVIYSVGRIERIFLLPQAITVDRYTAFKANMSKKDAKKFEGIYSLKKPEKMAEDPKGAELLALYPELANQPLYILKDGTSENNKKSNEAILAAAGYTQEDYDLDMQLVAGAKENTNPVFNVTIEYRLDGDDFLVKIPYSELRYRTEYPITGLTVLPMFGAAGLDEEGFMFVPEGGGALIRYNNDKLSQNAYFANLYGWDYGSERRELVSETKNTFPVFGMTKQGGSFICMIEGATVSAGIQADIAKRNNSYNSICARYTVLHSDRYNVSAKTANLVYMFEKDLPKETIIQRYRFIDSDSYVDMATAYGKYLRETHPELAAKQAGEDMPISVEMVGAIDKKVVKFGMPVDSVEPATTFKQAEDIMYDLVGAGVKNLNIRYTGWCNGGVNQKVLTGVHVLGQLGGTGGMKQLIESAKNKGVDLFFDGISCFAYRSGLFQGFIPFRDAARFTTREQIQIYPYSPITYQPNEDIDPFYLVQPGYAKKCASNLIGYLDKQDAAGVAFRDIGFLLSGDYNPRENVTREQVRQMNLETLKEAQAAGEKILIKEGFDFAVPYADLITDMDVNGIKYTLLDAQVPFYQIALHGLVDYTGLSINLADDWQTELLRCAEYGAGLNFTFMAEDAKLVQDTFHSDYYGATYSFWETDAAEIITGYQTAMKGLNRTAITGHRILTPDVTVTEYANGAKVYVNYGTRDYQGEGTTVPARSYIVTGGESK